MKIKTWLSGQVARTDELVNRLPWWMTSSFILAVVCMNLLANKSIVTMRYLALDAGFLISWAVFLGMDVLVRAYGAQVANRLSVVAMVCNLAVSAVFWVASRIPGTWGESLPSAGSQAAINQALDNTIGGTWYVLLGSATAFLVSAFVNNGLNAMIGRFMKAETFFSFACCGYISTAVGQLVDNLIFALLVSHVLLGWTMVQCLMCAVVAAAFELLMEILASPLGYACCRRLKRQNCVAK